MSTHWRARNLPRERDRLPLTPHPAWGFLIAVTVMMGAFYALTSMIVDRPFITAGWLP